MKNLKYFLLAAVMLFSAGIVFSSCSKDDDIEKADQKVENDDFSVGIKDNGNNLVLTYKQNYGNGYYAKVTITAEFDGKTDDALCTKCVMKMTSNVPNVKDETEDMTNDLKGLPKATVKLIFQQMLDTYKD